MSYAAARALLNEMIACALTSHRRIGRDEI